MAALKKVVFAALFLTGCSPIDVDLGHLKIGTRVDPYQEEIEQGQLELARESIHNAELRRELDGYAK